MTNLLLWKNAASVPMCAMRNARCFTFFEDTFELAGSLSHNISIEVSELFTEFVSTPLTSGFIENQASITMVDILHSLKQKAP
jgi:hypothetical protein